MNRIGQQFQFQNNQTESYISKQNTQTFLMYYRQLPCIYHPDMRITNFCQDQDCLMPLCPSCIRQHTEYHEQLHTKPSYFNIYEALAQTDTLITNFVCNLQKDRKRNSQLIFRINRLPTILHDKILHAKTLAIKIIQQTFTQLERDALQALTKINEQMNLHSLRKSQNLQETILANLQDLYDLADGLKTQSCLSDMIFFLKQKRFEVEHIHAQMTRYLYENQNYEPYIEVSKEAQQSLVVVIQRMLKLDPKEKSNPNHSRSFAGEKSIIENSYHISLTPSKIKKSINADLNDKKTNPSSRLNNHSRPKNSSYQNYQEYQDQIHKSRQTSRQKSLSMRGAEDSSFRPISLKEKQKRVYYQNIESEVRGKNSELGRKLQNTKLGNINKF